VTGFRKIEVANRVVIPSAARDLLMIASRSLAAFGMTVLQMFRFSIPIALRRNKHALV